MSQNLFTIAVEEHFATTAILQATASVAGPMDSEAARVQVPALLDLGEGRIAAMDEAGVDVQVVSHTAPGLEWVAGAEAVPLAREANDRLHDAISRYPQRLAGMATLPVRDPRAADELRRAAGLGLTGAVINGSADGRFLDDPQFSDLLTCAEELMVPLYIHPGVPPDAVRQAYYSGFPEPVSGLLATAAWGWHADTAVHVLRMMLAGIFDRHPRLTIVVGHLGEMLPVMAARAETLLGRVANLQRPLREYFAHQVYISTAGFYDRHLFGASLELVGVERLLFSTDYPYVPAGPAVSFLREVQLDAAELARFAGGNAAALYGLAMRAERHSRME